MIVYVNEEPSFRNWVTHHRTGFVLDGRFKLKGARLVLHRAGCAALKRASRRSTIGPRFKACAATCDELIRWSQDFLHRPVGLCPACAPDADVPAPSVRLSHRTPLCSAILEYLLDVAAIHSDEGMSPYHVTEATIAAYLGKSPAQLAAALARLRQEGLIEIGPPFSSRGRPTKERIVYPTEVGLATAPEYAAFSTEQLAAELEKLTGTRESIAAGSP
jgi:hypothetical protein